MKYKNSNNRLRLLCKTVVLMLIMCMFTSCVTHKDEQAESEPPKPDKTAEQYVEESNTMLGAGMLRSALQLLYEGLEQTDTPEVIEKALNEYYERISFFSTNEPGECEPEYCFENTTPVAVPDGEIQKKVNKGILLIDNNTGISATLFTISMFCEDGQEQLSIIERKEEKLLLTVSRGAGFGGQTLTFIYNIKDNKMSFLESNGYRTKSYGDVIIGTTPSYALGDVVSVFSYDWNGNLLFEKKEIEAYYIKDGWLYFGKRSTEENIVYYIQKIRTDGTEEQSVCHVEVPGNSRFAWLLIENDQIKWYDGYIGEKTMPLYQPYDYRLEIPEWKTELYVSKAEEQLIERVIGVERVENIQDDGEMIFCNTQPNFFGVEIEKATKKVSVYTTAPGRLIEEFYMN